MRLPLAILALATAAAAALAYGVHPAWGQTARGMQLILWTAQWQWALAALTLIGCVALIGLVAAGNRRAWWLLGLGPVLALFVHRFVSDPVRGLRILSDPPFVAAAEVRFVQEEDWVVGLLFNGSAYAYPYAALWESPVVVQADHDQRCLLIWSAYANRAAAFLVDRSLRARDLEIISMPADALLLYNGRLGQFINGLTGRQPDGRAATGLLAALSAQKTTWRTWRQAHPDTLLLAWDASGSAPRRPLQPRFAAATSDDPVDPATPVALVSLWPPMAIAADQLKNDAAATARAGERLVILVREPQGTLRAMDGQIEEDLYPQYELKRGPAGQTLLTDSDTGTDWALDGRALNGDLAREGRRLANLPVEEGLYWGSLKRWMPQLSLATMQTLPGAAPLPAEPLRSQRAAGRERKPPPRPRR